MKYALCILLLLFSSPLPAQPPAFAAGILPDIIKKNAHSVRREETVLFDVRSAGKAFYKLHTVTTILDDGAKEQLELIQFSDKFHQLESAEIKLLDADGNLISKHSKKDFSNMANGEGLVPDGKVYFLTLSARVYPVTVVEDYEIKFNGLLDYPDYEIIHPKQSVENASFTVSVPTDIGMRYKLKNTTVAPVVSTSGKYISYNWQFKNIEAIEYEEGGVSRESSYPKIIVAPNKFELDGYEGDMTTWQNFGKWYGSLAKGSMNLGNERKAALQEMVKDIAATKEKIKTIYTYLQKNFRYVSIQLGIGGFKPFEASFVDNKKYGDCKALCNYTQACLDAVGIKSYQALINAEYNKEPVDPDFPNNMFNHVIVCVPLEKDSVWLECTSRTNDFGVLGSFTENKNALLITEEGGKLVPTPQSKAADNIFNCVSIIKIEDDGSGHAQVTLKNDGEYKQDILNYVATEKKDDQKKFLVNNIGFINPDEFEITISKNNPGAETIIKMKTEKIPEFTAGNKMFLNPRIYKIWNYNLPKAEGRTQDFYFQHPFVKTDSTIYLLPPGYTIETLPKPKTFHFEYGSFSSSYFFDVTKNLITVNARLVLNQHKIPVAKFAAAKKFFDQVLEEYAEKIVIKK